MSEGAPLWWGPGGPETLIVLSDWAALKVRGLGFLHKSCSQVAVPGVWGWSIGARLGHLPTGGR